MSKLTLTSALSVTSAVNSSRIAEAARWVGLLGVISIAALRCLIVFAPQVVFDVDPAIDPTALSGLGPGGSLLLDSILLASCAFAILGEWWSGRGIDLGLMSLALMPLPVVLWHGWSDGLDLWRGMTWATAAVAAATAAHLVRDRSMRMVMIASLAGVIAPILIRGASQITVEHADMVRLFEERRGDFLVARGWEPDSPAAKIYERRLRQPQPLGWFATSNIFASLAAVGLVLWAGLAVAAHRARLSSGWPAAMALLALACGAMLWMTGSKGAILAGLVGLGLLVAAMSIASLGRVVQARPAMIVFGLIALALLGVAVRGAVLPESFANEKSLLFRWHYMIASARMFMDSPLTGVGPDGYQAAYTLFRVPRNPEEVTSAHSIFVDWICTLGVSGLAWSALIGLMLSRGATNEQDRATSLPAESSRRGLNWTMVGVAGFVVLVAAIIESASLDAFGIGIRVLGAFGFIAAALLTMHVVAHSALPAMRIIVIAATAVLLVHSQIEMTFHQGGAVTWAWLIVALTGGARSTTQRQSRVAPGAVAAIVFLATAIMVAVRDAIPALRQEARMVSASEQLGRESNASSNHAAIIRMRRDAAAQLVEAYEAWPRNPLPLEAAATQLELTCAGAGDGQPIGLLLEAEEIIHRAISNHNRPNSIAIAAGVAARLAQATGDAEAWRVAIHHSRQLAQRDPHGIGAWRRLGDVLWSAGQVDEAMAAYRRALENDANFALDDLKRLPERDRTAIQQRINTHREANGSTRGH